MLFPAGLHTLCGFSFVQKFADKDALVSKLRLIHTGREFAFVPNCSNELPLKCMTIRPLNWGQIPIRDWCEWALKAGTRTRDALSANRPEVMSSSQGYGKPVCSGLYGLINVLEVRADSRFYI